MQLAVALRNQPHISYTYTSPKFRTLLIAAEVIAPGCRDALLNISRPIPLVLAFSCSYQPQSLGKFFFASSSAVSFRPSRRRLCRRACVTMVRFNIECDLPFSREDFWRIRASPAFLSFIVSDGLLKKMAASPVSHDASGWATRCQHYCPAQVDCPDFIRAFVGDTLFEVDDYQRWHDDERPFQLDFNIKPSFLATLSKTYGTLRVDAFEEGKNGGVDELEGVMDDGSEGNGAGESADGLGSVGGSTDAEGSESGDGSDSSECEQLDTAALLAALPTQERSVHVVSGETRVSVLTVGWFVERAIVHNLKNFYKMYPATAMRFRQKLYAEFADCDEGVECSVVVDRFLQKEEQEREKRERAERAREWAEEGLDGEESLEEDNDDWDDVE